MGLKKTRVLLSSVLMVIISFSFAVMAVSLTASATIASRNFMFSHIVTDELVEECNNQLNRKFDALSAECGIPAHVFKMIETDFSTEEMLALEMNSLYDSESIDMHNDERAEYFKNMCIEYLEGNDIEYKNAYVERAAEKAAKIYGDTVGIHNAEPIKNRLSAIDSACAKYGSAALVVAIACVIAIVTMFNKKSKGFEYIIFGILGGGAATAIGALLMLIFKTGTKIYLSPIVYKQVFIDIIQLYQCILAATGLAIIAIGAFLVFLYYKKINRKLIRRA